MIVLDTRIWVWWVDGSPQFTSQYRNWIDEHKADGLGISVISCWEVAKLVENGRLKLQCFVEDVDRASISLSWYQVVGTDSTHSYRINSTTGRLPS